MRNLKLYAAGPLAGVMTAVLFYGMQSLVAGEGEVQLDQQPPVRIFASVQEPDETVIQTKEWHVPEPEFVDPPIVDPVDTTIPIDPTAIPIGPIAPPVAPNPGTQLPNLGQSDGEHLPLVVVQPNYPDRAATRGIEGYVVVELTVAADGTVPKDSVRVVVAEPKGYFERDAKKAAAKFKYKPKIVDGVAQPVHGVRYQFTFELGSD